MTKYEKAAQIMPILRFAAKYRQTVTYGDIATAVGGASVGVGQWLGPIAYYCQVNKLPPLTVLVVKDKTGEPGEGYPGTRATIDRDREAVFTHEWLPRWAFRRLAPTAAELEIGERTFKAA